MVSKIKSFEELIYLTIVIFEVLQVLVVQIKMVFPQQLVEMIVKQEVR